MHVYTHTKNRINMYIHSAMLSVGCFYIQGGAHIDVVGIDIIRSRDTLNRMKEHSSFIIYGEKGIEKREDEGIAGRRRGTKR